MPVRSLSRSFLLGVGATAVTTTVLASLAAFFVYRADLTQRQLEHTREYVDQRGQVVRRRFTALAEIHAKAAAQLTAHMDALPAAQAAALLDRHFPLQPDDTRRSRPGAFDGEVDGEGDRISGMGAFIGRGRDVDPVTASALVSAFHVVRHFGEGVNSSYDNFYFATPDNRVIIYGPDRPDRLMFYRHDAPASLDISGQEMMRMVAPAADPTGRTRCTSLQRLIQDQQGKRLATACMTPFSYHGRYLGAFGSTIQLRDYLTSTVHSEDDAVSLIVRREGDVIAMTDRSLTAAPSPEALERVDREYDMRRLLGAIHAEGRDRGVLRSPNGRFLVGYARIPGPDWWLLLAYPEAHLQAAAMKPAFLILGLGLLAALVQTALIVIFARRTLATPLQRLAASCETDAPTDDLQRRDDEIGVLGRALAAERAKAQAAVVCLEERVAARTADLERASSEKDRFLANMSHELRTPLNGVIAVSEILAGLQRSARAREMARLIVSSSRLLERVLADVLDFSRLEAGEVRLAAEPFDLVTALEHVTELHRVVAAGKSLSLHVEVSPELKGRWTGDAIRITQIVSNLLSNAVKFTEAGRVTLHAAASPQGVTLAVADTGIGFGPDVQARLFQRFEQADPSIRRRFGGSGLGLAICKSLAEAMGGRIRAASAPGVGSTFTVELPLPRSAAPSADDGAAAVHDEAALAGVRVLLAEDHPTNQKVVELILQTAGVELVIVENGREALEALGAGGGFDLVLMDMQMPQMDGLSATRLWREREAMLRLRRTPIVMLTAHALDEHVEQSLRAGADHHLSKPIRAAELLTVVDALTSEERREAA